MKPELAPQEWMVEGACRSVDAELFFPEPRDYDTERAAKRICEGCFVWQDCREYALTHQPTAGIWGGLTAREIDRAVRRWRRAS